MARHSLVLCYHAVSGQWPSPLAVSPERLREQLRWLKQRGYRAATFTEVVRGETPAGAVAVTFDDGFRSVVELGLPILTEFGFPGTIFVPTDFVDRAAPLSWPGIEHWERTSYADELATTTWEDLDRLKSAGWEIGSHTLSHPRLTELDDETLAIELAASRQACEQRLGKPCRSLAYPYGDRDARVRGAAEKAGYVAAAALRPGREKAFDWPRVGIYPIDDLRRFRIKTSTTVRRLRATRPVELLERNRG